MFPTQSKVNRLRISPLWLLPVVALALLLAGYVVFNAAPAEAQAQPAGDFCIEGIVINWKEEPLDGWRIFLTGTVVMTQTPTTVVLSTTSAPEPDEDVKDPEFLKGEFAFKEKDGIPQWPGTYTVTIESRPGWDGVTPTTITFPLDAGNDDCVKIRFKMRRIIPVDVVKIDANHVPLDDWKIKVVPGAGNLFATPDEEKTVSGTATFTLTPGNWVFMEMPPKPDDITEPQDQYMPVVPPSGRQEVNLDEDEITATQRITVVFKNELVTGCIAVVKQSVPAPVTPTPAPSAAFLAPPIGTVDPTAGYFNVAGWTFTLKRKDGTIARQGVTDATGRVEFDNLPLGPYVLVEENRAGWNEEAPGFRTLDVNVEGNQCDNLINGSPTDPETGLPNDETIYFDNYQDDSGFCVEGYKVDANGGYGIPGWKIKIKPLDKGGYDPDDVYTDGLGKYHIDFPSNDYRIPGGKFEICEEEKDGWLPHTDTCQTVVLPDWPMGDCVQLNDFVNQQVGHSESEKGWGGMDGGPMGDGPHGDGPMGGPGMGDHSMSCSSTYEVKPGEGLFDIARSFKVSPQAMLDANPDVAKNQNQWVYVGQRICIP